MRVNLTRFERYGDIIDDWDAFACALATPLPVCAWVNTLRTTNEEALEWVRRCGLDPMPLGWVPNAFKLHEERSSFGTLAPFLLGMCHIQEEVSIIPSVLLAPKPHERILDTCAAPGGKTALMAIHMRNQGTILANDKSFARLRALRSIIDRLGITNISMLNTNAANFKRTIGSFDRILVDAPCSCEGTSRKNRNILEKHGVNFDGFARLQYAILKRAMELVTPGGRVVYSTCTYAPEENELVVDRVLRACEDAKLCKVFVDGLKCTPGLTHWNAQDLHPDLCHTMRFYPHHNNTGGFFVAVLERTTQLPD